VGAHSFFFRNPEQKKIMVLLENKNKTQTMLSKIRMTLARKIGLMALVHIYFVFTVVNAQNATVEIMMYFSDNTYY
jgi:hypothetical protein